MRWICSNKEGASPSPRGDDDRHDCGCQPSDRSTRIPGRVVSGCEPEPWWPTAVSPTMPASVLAMPKICYRCGSGIQALIGALVDVPGLRTGFVWFDDVAEAVAGQVAPAILARSGVGPIRWRRSRPRPEGYLANGCVRCDAIQGSFPLSEEVAEYLAEGGRLQDLPVVATIEVALDTLEEGLMPAD